MQESNIDNLAAILDRISQVAPRRYPRVTDLLLALPPWLRALGTPEGVAALEHQRGIVLPHSLRLYFACPALACWLKAHAETDAFLDDESLSNPSPVVRWSEQAYLVVGHFAHSDTVVAVQVDCADPIVAWGYLADTQSFPLHPLPFAGWLDGIVGDILGPFRKPT